MQQLGEANSLFDKRDETITKMLGHSCEYVNEIKDHLKLSRMLKFTFCSATYFIVHHVTVLWSKPLQVAFVGHAKNGLHVV